MNKIVLLTVFFLLTVTVLVQSSPIDETKAMGLAETMESASSEMDLVEDYAEDNELETSAFVENSPPAESEEEKKEALEAETEVLENEETEIKMVESTLSEGAETQSVNNKKEEDMSSTPVEKTSMMMKEKEEDKVQATPLQVPQEMEKTTTEEDQKAAAAMDALVKNKAESQKMTMESVSVLAGEDEKSMDAYQSESEKATKQMKMLAEHVVEGMDQPTLKETQEAEKMMDYTKSQKVEKKEQATAEVLNVPSLDEQLAEEQATESTSEEEDKKALSQMNTVPVMEKTTKELNEKAAQKMASLAQVLDMEETTAEENKKALLEMEKSDSAEVMNVEDSDEPVDNASMKKASEAASKKSLKEMESDVQVLEMEKTTAEQDKEALAKMNQKEKMNEKIVLEDSAQALFNTNADLNAQAEILMGTVSNDETEQQLKLMESLIEGSSKEWAKENKKEKVTKTDKQFEAEAQGETPPAETDEEKKQALLMGASVLDDEDEDSEEFALSYEDETESIDGNMALLTTLLTSLKKGQDEEAEVENFKGLDALVGLLAQQISARNS